MNRFQILKGEEPPPEPAAMPIGTVVSVGDKYVKVKLGFTWGKFTVINNMPGYLNLNGDFFPACTDKDHEPPAGRSEPYICLKCGRRFISGW